MSPQKNSKGDKQQNLFVKLTSPQGNICTSGNFPKIPKRIVQCGLLHHIFSTKLLLIPYSQFETNIHSAEIK